MNYNELLRLHLQQLMSEEDDGGGAGAESTGAEDDKAGEDETGAEPGKDNGEGGEEKSFTQAELDAIIQERLARERKKQDDAKKQAEEEAKQKRLEEQEEWKELAQSLQAQIDEHKTKSIESTKQTKLISAGYSEEQAELLHKLVDGETDEDITASVEELKKTVPVNKKEYVDPSENNGRSPGRKKTDKTEVGTSAWDRIKGKVRR